MANMAAGPVYMKALYNYNATGEFSKEGVGEISICKDDIMILLETTTNGWTKGKLEKTGQIGYVPSNYVKQVIKQAGGVRVVVTMDYEASGVRINSGDSDMSVKKGDV